MAWGASSAQSRKGHHVRLRSLETSLTPYTLELAKTLGTTTLITQILNTQILNLQILNPPEFESPELEYPEFEYPDFEYPDFESPRFWIHMMMNPQTLNPLHSKLSKLHLTWASST